ncbi:MAG: hypothetical protein OEW67_05760 [Cyclobacteriaceae bacterium]|nr:hypothetical protein [Cyclobacteriaceae bacterium]
MKINYSFINYYLLTFILLSFSCNQVKKESYIYLDYYYEFKDLENSSLSSKVVNAIQKHIKGNS